MKKILLFIFLPLSIYSQNPIIGEGLYDSIRITCKEAVPICKENVEEESNNEENINVVCREELVTIILLDVFKYYDLESLYSSDLKKSVYMQTQDYKDKLRELKLLKREYTSHNLYLELNKNVNFSIGDYDLEKRGFNIYVGGDRMGDGFLGFGDEDDKEFILGHRKEIYYQFAQLPIKKRRNFFFPISKQKALEIENSTSDDMKMILLFKPLSVTQFKSKKYFNYTETFISTNKVEVIILDSATSTLYYRKSFVNSKK
jgi:hypothetical protein